jgi:hypothetical protein
MPITQSSSGMCAGRAWAVAFIALNRLTREALVA